MEMELDYVSIEPRFHSVGFLNGAGRPARVQTTDGSILPLLSLATQIEDDVLLGSFAYSNHLDLPTALARIDDAMVQALLHRVPLTVNLHPSLEVERGGALLAGLLSLAQRHEMPVISAERLSAWTWARLAVQRDAHLTREGDEWVVSGGLEGAGSVPLLLWKPHGECAQALSAWSGGPAGCLSALVR